MEEPYIHAQGISADAGVHIAPRPGEPEKSIVGESLVWCAPAGRSSWLWNENIHNFFLNNNKNAFKFDS